MPVTLVSMPVPTFSSAPDAVSPAASENACTVSSMKT